MCIERLHYIGCNMHCCNEMATRLTQAKQNSKTEFLQRNNAEQDSSPSCYLCSQATACTVASSCKPVKHDSKQRYVKRTSCTSLMYLSLQLQLV